MAAAAPRRWVVGAVVGLAAVVTAVAAVLAVDERKPAAATELDRIVARCTEDMVRQTCRVMGSAAGASVPDGTVVFVAGIGAIEAEVYNRLRADGEAMCSTVRRSCSSDWAGRPCRTARALYGGA
jgi:hypothetical protein